MNLDDYHAFPQLDPENMMAHIDGLPEQLKKAWDLGSKLPLSPLDGIEQVLIAGMGGSAIGADLLVAYITPQCRVPVFVHRDYNLPAWAHGQHTLFIASSHSGNTEETLSAFEGALKNQCRIICVSTGGKLAAAAEELVITLWRFEHKGQPRSAVGFSFGLLLAIFHRLSLIPDPTEALAKAIQTMKAQQVRLRPEVPVVQNPAKRMAGQLMNRWVTVVGADYLAPVARRWKGQISEIAKAWGQFEFLPELDHNTLAGIMQPEDQFARMMVLFLRAPGIHPRNLLRTDLTRKIFMLEGVGTDFIDAQGETRLDQIWTALHFGDYTAYYLAMAYQVDPTPVEAIENFKRDMVVGE